MSRMKSSDLPFPSHKLVVHDPPLVLLQYLFESTYIVVADRLDQVGHGHDLGIIAMCTRLVRVKRIDTAGVDHTCHDEVFQASQPTPVARLALALERLEEGL